MTNERHTDRNRPIDTRNNTVSAFPHLVYKELLAALAALLLLTLWSLAWDAPLKEMADPNWTENPAKAPWYFVGLQEMLVYFDPWIAGVCLPLMIIVGLAALPYLDPGTQGSGGYFLRQRKLAVGIFLFGYVFWFVLILIGEYLRGPSWQFYWPWEDWSVHKPIDTALVDLPLPWGTVLFGGYFGLGLILPAFLKKGHLKQMGGYRYLLAWVLALVMFGLLGKVVLRLLFDVKYIIHTPYLSI